MEASGDRGSGTTGQGGAGRRLTVAVAGASGLVGGALVASLEADGHRVRRLVRREPRGGDEIRWDPHSGRLDPAALAGCDAVVNLAGAGVGDRRWTEAYKREIRDSRVLGTRALAGAIAAMDRPPEVFLNGSAIGYYGETGDRAVDESAPHGRGFLPELTVEWEAAADPARAAGVRTVLARTGLVVARQGGAWGRLFPLFRAGLGGRLGDGRQYWSFVALRDEIDALRHLLLTPGLEGPFNVTAPVPATNREVTAAMAKVLRRPAVFAVPAPVLRTVLGGMSQDVLGSARVLPARLRESGFTFSCPDVESAVRAALED